MTNRVDAQYLDRRESLVVGLVRSLFCGLPSREHRLAVFLAASDESHGANTARYGGYVYSALDWSEAFTPAWEEMVLDGPPRIPFLHMTDIRSDVWREQHGLTRRDAEDRVDAAIDVIVQTGGLFPVVSGFARELYEDTFKRALAPYKRFLGGRAWTADDMNFIWFALTVLQSAPRWFRLHDVEKVDFVVECNGGATERLLKLHGDLGGFLEHINRPELVPLVGGFSAAGKERVPLQAADVFLWHCQRVNSSECDGQDYRRYMRLARRPGRPLHWTEPEVIEMVSRLKARGMLSLALEHNRAVRHVARLMALVARGWSGDRMQHLLRKKQNTVRNAKAKLLADGFDVDSDSLELLTPPS